MKTYKIVPGNTGKQNIEYYNGAILECKELYSQGSFVADIKPGYSNQDGPKWSNMYEALLSNDALIVKMLGVTAMSGYLASVYAILQRGVDGFPNEARLSWLLNRPGWNWTANEKQQMNTYFSNNGFSITIT